MIAASRRWSDTEVTTSWNCEKNEENTTAKVRLIEIRAEETSYSQNGDVHFPDCRYDGIKRQTLDLRLSR